MKLLTTIGVLVACSASAQQTMRQVPGVDGVYTVSPPSSTANEWAFLHDAGRQGFAAAGGAIGADIGQALRTPHVRAIILTDTCGEYTDAVVVYDTNAVKTMHLDSPRVPASDSSLEAIRASVPTGVSVVAIKDTCNK